MYCMCASCATLSVCVLADEQFSSHLVDVDYNLHIFQLQFLHNCHTSIEITAIYLHIFDVNFLAKAISFTRNALNLDKKNDF